MPRTAEEWALDFMVKCEGKYGLSRGDRVVLSDVIAAAMRAEYARGLDRLGTEVLKSIASLRLSFKTPGYLAALDDVEALVRGDIARRGDPRLSTCDVAARAGKEEP